MVARKREEKQTRLEKEKPTENEREKERDLPERPMVESHSNRAVRSRLAVCQRQTEFSRAVLSGGGGGGV